jgi:hypothetical protein
MTSLELTNILYEVFGQTFYVDPKSRFSSIDVTGTGLKFITYSDIESVSSHKPCIWYCSVRMVNEIKEVKIPSKMTKEFIEEIYELSKSLNKISIDIDSIRKRFNQMNDQDSIRDMKLKSLGL